MSPIGDLLSRLFASGRAQGLSGVVGSVAGHDGASVFHASRMRKHVTDADLLVQPDALWTSSAPQRGAGLAPHLQAEGAAGRVDALIVLNAADADRVGLGASMWGLEAGAVLAARMPGLRVRIVRDASADTGNEDFALGPGEYITVLGQGLHLGPRADSRPVLAVHLNVPGAWEGYRELGRLWSDQSLLTIGSHWLDNVSHPTLRAAALYRLQQEPDGSLVHLVSPDHQDAYEVRSDITESGASVLTLAEREGGVIAYIVLALLDEAEDGAPLDDVVSSLAGASSDAASPEGASGTPSGLRAVDGPGTSDPVPSDPVPAQTPASAPMVADSPLVGLDSAAYGLETGARARAQRIHRTVVPDAVEARILALQERGALLQRVHFAQFMDGYDVFIGSGGRVSTQETSPRATLSVRGERVTLAANLPGVRLDGLPIGVDVPIPLVRDALIEVDGHAFQYRDLSRVSAAGWPYLGELRRTGAATYLAFGERHRIGRDRRCKVRLPDEPHNDNLVWKAAIGVGGTVRAQQGDIPKSRFYTDSIMVASEHAEIDLTADPTVRSLARSCFTFVRRDGMVLPLSPNKPGGDGPRESDLRSGDELLVGNCLFSVSYAPASDGMRPALPATLPPVMFPAAAEITAPPPPLPRIAHTVDVVVAAGLGERGPAPRPPSAPVPSMPSLPPPVGTVPSSSGANQPQTFPFPRSGPATPATDTREVSADSAPYALTVDGGVPTVDEAHATRELSRPARLVLDGWLVDDALVVGNHEGADIRVPELRAFEEQAFLWLDYFRIELSDGSPTVTLLQPGEARLTADGVEVERAEGAGAALYVARRDASLDVGFEVALRLVKDAALGGHLLAVDTVPRAVAGLFTIGLEPRTARDVRFDTAGTVRASLVFDGAGVRVRSAEGGPLRASRVGARFRPLAMSGTEGAVLLCRGDRLQVGRAVYRVEVG